MRGRVDETVSGVGGESIGLLKTSFTGVLMLFFVRMPQGQERTIPRFYPNQQHLRKRNTIVEHPYGTVKRWHGAGYLLTKSKLKVAAETGLSFLAYNFRRVINLLGVNGIMTMIKT